MRFLFCAEREERRALNGKALWYAAENNREDEVKALLESPDDVDVSERAAPSKKHKTRARNVFPIFRKRNKTTFASTLFSFAVRFEFFLSFPFSLPFFVIGSEKRLFLLLSLPIRFLSFGFGLFGR